MKRATKISIIGIITIFFSIFGISQYVQKRVIKESLYLTHTGNMLIGGMSSDKEKLESFKRDLEKDKDDPFNRYLDAAYSYKKQGDYQNAIIQAEKALELAKSKGDHWMVRTELAELYEKVGKYDLALKEYEWLQDFQTKVLEISRDENNTLDIAYRKKILDELAAARKRVEELQNTTNTRRS